MKRHPLLICLISIFICLALLAGCKAAKSKKSKTAVSANLDMPMPRADPAYIQQLERISMLLKAGEVSKIVSGSELAWRSSGTHDGTGTILGYADIWLSINPHSFLSSSRRTVFDQLNDRSVWAVLREVGVKGVYIAPVFGSGSLWSNDKHGVMDTGDDIVQFAFAPTVGKDGQYRFFMNSVLDNNALVGSDLLPAATGIGPDFFLAARFCREYPGIYCMVEVPSELWKFLPEVASEWRGEALSKEQIASLNAERLLPKTMLDELSALSGNSGWAATGKIVGIDAVPRRWVYRYHKDPSYAVLNWEDPSRTANRILSGSAVYQVGLLGQSLIGLHFDAFMGLDAAPHDFDTRQEFSDNFGDLAEKAPEDAVLEDFPLEPALPAAQSISREIRRYGGWSWLRTEVLPLEAQEEFLRVGADFITDNALSPAAEHALLTGDATLLRFMGDELIRLNVDMRRMVHSMPTEDGVNYALPHLEYLAARPGGEEAATLLALVRKSAKTVGDQQDPSPYKDEILYTTGTGIAAMAIGLPLDIGNPLADGKSKSKEAIFEARHKQQETIKKYKDRITKAHSLLLFYKAMQPGILMVSGQDLVGAMPLQWYSMVDSVADWDVRAASRGGYALSSASSSLMVSQQGMPRTIELYAPADLQVHDEKSFMHNVGSFLRMRSTIGIASGKFIARPKVSGKGSMAMLFRLSDNNGYLLSVCNFTGKSVQENITIKDVPGFSSLNNRVTSVSTGSGNYKMESGTISLYLGPWEGTALIFKK